MNDMNDLQLDRLIADTLRREALLSDLNRLVIRDVRRRARRAWLRRWARVVAFCFGLPLVLALFALGAYTYIKTYGAEPLTFALLLLPTLGLLLAAARAVGDFSPDEV